MRLTANRKILLRENENVVEKKIKEFLTIPELIGEGCQYSNMKNFLYSFYTQANQHMKESRLRIVELESQVAEMMKDVKRVSKQDTFFRERVD